MLPDFSHWLGHYGHIRSKIMESAHGVPVEHDWNWLRGNLLILSDMVTLPCIYTLTVAVSFCLDGCFG